MRRIAAILLALALLLSAGAEAVPANWYEVFVRAYQDSDGDGLGDLNGLRARLDYIEDMGWRGLWLMPVMPSPSYHKYDVTDYYAVDPEYGTLDDLRALLDAAHARGIAVILDLPVNHCSSEHPWFQSACASPDSPYRDWFNWSETARNGYSEGGGMYYESRFVDTMPDLNLDNPAEISDLVCDLMV